MISIIIPAYNERATLPVVLERVKKAAPLEKEIIIVDDGSCDGTSEFLKKISSPGIKVIFHERNTGKGACIRDALKEVCGDKIIIQDADLEYHPRDYEELLKPLCDGRADAVFGSRFIGPHRVFLFSHYLGNLALNFIANFLYNANLSDMMTGYKAFTAGTLKGLKLKSDGFGIEAEITAELFKNGFRVYEVPVSYSGRSYEEGKKIRWYHFFIELYWLLRQKVAVYNVALDTLLKMGAARNYNRSIHSLVRPFIGERVLEVGGGIGNMTKYLLSKEELIVTDVSEDHIHYLRTRFEEYPNVKIIKHDIAQDNMKELGNYNFDTVLCLNILEHISDESKALANIRSIMGEKTRLVIFSPAMPGIMGSLDVALGHYRRYSRRGLVDLLTKSGFVVEKIHYFNWLGVLGWFLNSKILRKKGFSPWQVWIFDRFSWLTHFDRELNLPLGLSLLAVCKKA